MDELIIEAGRAERQYLRDLWRYWELFMFLGWRDLLVRYKQAVADFAVAVFFQPISDDPTIFSLFLAPITGSGGISG